MDISFFFPVLRIHLILMQIRILDPHWKKVDSDPGQFFKIYWIVLTKIIFKFFVLFFSLIFILKLDEPFRNEEIFTISLFSKVQIWVLGAKKCFFAVFGWYFNPRIRIHGSAYFCGSGSRKPKSCRSNGSGS